MIVVGAMLLAVEPGRADCSRENGTGQDQSFWMTHSFGYTDTWYNSCTSEQGNSSDSGQINEWVTVPSYSNYYQSDATGNDSGVDGCVAWSSYWYDTYEC